MQDNITNIINNALQVDKSNLNETIIKSIVKQIKIALDNNKDAIVQANKIDISKNNGYTINFEIINNIFNLLNKETKLYGSILLSQKDDEKGLIYGKQIFDIGNVLVINDGNPYTLIEIVVRNIISGNTVIISNKGFMYGTNNLLIQIIQAVFEQYNISKYFVQLYVTEDYEFLQNNYANLDLIICIGNKHLHNIVLSKSKVKTIVSGYEYFDLYIDDNNYIDFINKLDSSNLNIQMYINANMNIEKEGTIIVSDVDEAIAQINYNGSKYSAAIFTSNPNNASKFIKEVKSQIITVNTSPSIERIMDIKQSDFYKEKIIIYPDSFKYNGRIDINLNS